MEDISPLPVEQRNWRWQTYVAMWIGLVANPGMYSFGGSLLALGITPAAALALLAVGGFFIALATVVNSAAGVTYGIPFPVYARAAFGVEGAKYAALSRGVVGVMWLSFQLWQPADAIVRGIEHAAGPPRSRPPQVWSPYLSVPQLVGFVLVAGVHVGCIALGVKRFDRLTYVLAPLGVVYFALISLWATLPEWGGAGLTEIFRVHSQEAPHGGAQNSWGALITGLNSTVGMWSTLMLNMADLARLAPSQRHQVIGQMLGIPLPAVLACTVGILGSTAIQIRSGQASWQMADLFQFWPAWASVGGGLAVLAVTLVVNLSANIIPPANDFMNLLPARLRWRWCAYATVVLACLACPWCLFHTAAGFAVRFLGGYGMVTGAIYGVMVSDYYIVRRRELGLSDLYPAKPGEGAYQYWHGHNWRAALATLTGVALPLPAWLASLFGDNGRASMPEIFAACGKASWFVAASVASLVYLVACVASPPAQSCAEKSPGDSAESGRGCENNAVAEGAA